MITGKFGPASKIDQSVFKNTDLNDLLTKLKKHFNVSCEYIDLGDEISQYHAIKLTSSSN